MYGEIDIMRQIVIDIIHDNRHVMYGEIDIMRQIVIDIIHDNSNVRRRDWYYATTVMCSVFVNNDKRKEGTLIWKGWMYVSNEAHT